MSLVADKVRLKLDFMSYVYVLHGVVHFSVNRAENEWADLPALLQARRHVAPGYAATC